jgi:hypothetical protein
MPTKIPTARTVAKKAPVSKKVVPKKAVKKSSVKRPLQYSDSLESFWLSDGQILNSLVALRDALASMDTVVYGHHVRSGKNDFAEWVLQVLDDAECAAALRSAKTPSAAKTIVVKYLKTYSI